MCPALRFHRKEGRPGRDDHNRGLEQTSLSQELVRGRKGRPQSWIPTCFSVLSPCQKLKGTSTIPEPNKLLCPASLSATERDRYNRGLEQTSLFPGLVRVRKGRPQTQCKASFSVRMSPRRPKGRPQSRYKASFSVPAFAETKGSRGGILPQGAFPCLAPEGGYLSRCPYFRPPKRIGKNR